MKSAFNPFDKRLAIINDVIKPAYAVLWPLQIWDEIVDLSSASQRKRPKSGGVLTGCAGGAPPGAVSSACNRGRPRRR